MWLFTKFGFFSIVQKPEDIAIQTVTIRSRVKNDLISLCKQYLKSDCKILTFENSDYRHRITVSKSEFASALMQIALDIDYDNFKNEVYRSQGSDRAAVYGDVWADVYQLQSKGK
jgi:hypothetical protein